MPENRNRNTKNRIAVMFNRFIFNAFHDGQNKEHFLPVLCSVRYVSVVSTYVSQRNPYGKRGSLTFHTVYFDGTAVHDDGIPCNSKTKTGSADFPGM